jgi:serine/threonine-protein kinase HipA
MRTLDVYLFGERCGSISESIGLDYTFAYDPAWRRDSRHGISMCLPRREAPSTAEAERAYFGGLLPEGAARRRIAQDHGFDELDDLAFLTEFGRDCPGAVQVLPANDPLPHGGVVSWLEGSTLRTFVDDLRIPDDVAGVDRYSISLAGAQLKRGVVVDGDAAVGIPTGDRLSTHILKLAVRDMPGVVENEHAIQRLASAIGIRAATSSVLTIMDERVLLSTRYDRVDGEALHQEDFCQALGRLSSHKYERFDQATGASIGPGILDMVELLRTRTRPSVHHVDELVRAFWFNVLVGNVDAHAKNYSLLYRSELDDVQIAPMYDSICIMAHHADEEAATRHADEPLVMQIGGQTRFWQLTRRDIDMHARSLRIQPRYLRTQVRRLTDRVADALDPVLDELQADERTSHRILDQIRSEVTRRCEFVRTLVS